MWTGLNSLQLFLFYTLKCNLFLWCKVELSASLLQISVSHDPSEIILICRLIFLWKQWQIFQIQWLIQFISIDLKYKYFVKCVKVLLSLLINSLVIKKVLYASYLFYFIIFLVFCSDIHPFLCLKWLFFRLIANSRKASQSINRTGLKQIQSPYRTLTKIQTLT